MKLGPALFAQLAVLLLDDAGKLGLITFDWDSQFSAGKLVKQLTGLGVTPALDDGGSGFEGVFAKKFKHAGPQADAADVQPAPALWVTGPLGEHRGLHQQVAVSYTPLTLPTICSV